MLTQPGQSDARLQGLVKQSMSPEGQGDEEMLMQLLAKAAAPQQPNMGGSLNPYAAGLRADPANVGNAGRIEGDPEAALRQLLMEEMRKSQAPAGIQGQYPQQVKQPQLRR